MKNHVKEPIKKHKSGLSSISLYNKLESRDLIHLPASWCKPEA